MALLSTSFPPDSGQRDIVFEIGDPIMDQAEFLIDYLHEEVAAGTRFEPEEFIQVGWNKTLIREAGAYLELFEPDFRSHPLEWMHGLRSTIRHLLLHNYMAEALGVEPWFPSTFDHGLVSARFLGDAKAFTLLREGPSPGGQVSGWRFLASDEGKGAEADLEPRMLYEIALASPRVIPFLALPPGTRVDFAPELIRVSAAGTETISSAENDFLAELSRV